ncbi:MAG: hypothetical protein ACLPWS_22830, partial [Rhodomicrobium sp.]
MATPSSVKAMAMVFSRPIRSDTQPKKGRVKPLVMRSKVKAAGMAAMVTPKMVTAVVPPMPKDCTKLLNCVITMRLEFFDHAEDAAPARVIDLDSARNRTGDVWHIWVE